METKVHFKLHKVKKQWVTIAVSSLALGAALLSGGQAKADESLAEPAITPSGQASTVNDSVDTSADLVTRTEESPVNTTEATTTTSETASLTETTTAPEQASDKSDNADHSDHIAPATTIAPTATSDKANQADNQEQAVTSETAPLVTSGQFSSDDQGNWYYTKDGQKLTGRQNVDGFNLYFHEDGKQAKGEIVTRDGKSYYYDKDNGRLVTNTRFDLDGKTYQADADGVLTEGTLKIVTGGRFQSDDSGNWYYYNTDGQKLTGWQNVDGVTLFFDASGRQIKGQGVEIAGRNYRFNPDNGSLLRNQWYSQTFFNGYRMHPSHTTHNYYYGSDGATPRGWQSIDGNDYYFTDRGFRAENTIVTIDNQRYLFDDKAQLVRDTTYTIVSTSMYFPSKRTYRTNESGVVLTGKQVINGEEYLFGEDGVVLDTIHTEDGKKYFYRDSKLQKNFFGPWFVPLVYTSSPDFRGVFATDENGVLLEGVQKAQNGKVFYFTPSIFGISNNTWKEIDGKLYHFKKQTDFSISEITTSTALVHDGKVFAIDDMGVATQISPINNFYHDDQWDWYYFDKDGKTVTGWQTIDGVQLYFNNQGQQAKGQIADIDGKSYYFDKDSGALWTNTTLNVNGIDYSIDDAGVVTNSQRNAFIQDKDKDWLYIDNHGHMVTGWQDIDGKRLYFLENGKQVRGQRILIDGKYYYFNKDTGNMLRNGYSTTSTGFRDNIYFGEDGAQVFGWTKINGKRYYFDKETGRQVDRGLKNIDGQNYYFKFGGELLINGFDEYFYADESGHILTGWHTINGEKYYLTDKYSERSSGSHFLVKEGDNTFLINRQGKLMKNTLAPVTYYPNYYLSDSEGKIVSGFHQLDDGKRYYFEPIGVSLKDGGWKEIDGKLYHFEKAGTKDGRPYISAISTNTTLEKDGKTYIIDANGVATEEGA